jgi:hypothetical protein
VKRGWIILAAVLAGGCGEAPAAAPPSFADPPAATIASASGGLTITIWTSPSPLTKGAGAVRFEIADGTAAAVEGAALTATAWMPAHGHGASVTPSVTERGGGVYDVDGLLFYMTGRWEVRSELVDAAGGSDAFTAAFDVR